MFISMFVFISKPFHSLPFPCYRIEPAPNQPKGTTSFPYPFSSEHRRPHRQPYG